MFQYLRIYNINNINDAVAAILTISMLTQTPSNLTPIDIDLVSIIMELLANSIISVPLNTNATNIVSWSFLNCTFPPL